MIRTNEEFKLSDTHITTLLTKALGVNLNEILFFDIETTGLSPKNSDLYLIGVSYIDGDVARLGQFFAESADDEEVLLRAFSGLCENFKAIVHFNGNRFDIPFVQNKLNKYGLEDVFENLKSLDIYRLIKPYKDQLGLVDCKQKTIELYLGINREDKYDGGKLIPVYEKYKETQDKELLSLLLLHNAEDVKGMYHLLPMFLYNYFFSMFKNMPKVSIRTDEELDEASFSEYELPLKAVKVQANYYNDYNGKPRKEVYFKLLMPFALPSSLSGNMECCFFKTQGNEVTLRVPLYETELKYFYASYKDYYYLPKEDMAIHKSLATFVDKNYRQKATPENCYTKKEGQYLLEWDLVFSPFFKESYDDKRFFFDLNENMKKSRFAMSLYACHVIAHILEL
ncbi:ribonuclease H-like domain-containing protein [Butyrivibrio proteoclasticus]|uniref:ribonuclease H-like domain-containing protein n=1 Tax=Butyrivibrio proteoclasticus TaxID=43305 RepID=UPI00047E6C1E|nr:ribonuclease H-like domain-containing protein [Butyrivibrio proteoclasticus]